MLTLLHRMVAPYGPLEAWAYDRVVADAVTSFQGEAIEAFAPNLPGRAHLLDVGCGGGQNVLALSRRFPGWTFAGVDLSPGQVARARARTRVLGDRASFSVGSALDLPFADGTFDAALSVASVKHWPDPAKGLREMVRVLRSGGRLLVLEADRGCLLEDCRRFVNTWRMPAAARPLATMWFRTYVAGQAIDLEDARSLVAELRLRDARAHRLPGLPAVVFGGTKP